jgi:hypothetical protein
MRGQLYARSVASQAIVFVPVGAATFAITALLAPDFRLEAALFAIATTMNGFTASWYYSGIGTPRPLLINEGLVRLLGYGVALAGLLLGADLIWYAAVTVVAGIVMLVANWWTAILRPKVPIPRTIVRDGWRTVREEWFGTASRLIQSVYSFGGPSLFAVLSPPGLAAYSGARTVQVAASNGLSAVPNAFVSWVGSVSGETRNERIRRGNLAMAGFAAVMFVLVAALGQIGLDYLFAGRLELALLDRLLLALSIALAFYNRSYQLLVMIPLGHKDLVYRSTMISSVIGLGLYLALIPTLGVTGGLLVPPVVFVGLQIRYRSARTRTARMTASAP